MPVTFYRPTWVEVDLDAIRHNVVEIRKRLEDKSEVMAVVKANGYGHGAFEVAGAALEAGATSLGVALLEEAIELREKGITVPILVFGWVSPYDAPIAAEYDITITFFQEEWLEEASELSYDHTLKLHMKWDTGMGRVGIRTEDELVSLLEVFKSTSKKKSFSLTGVFTHFATADEDELDYFEMQYNRFESMLKTFNSHWDGTVNVHIGNSAASIRFPGKMQKFVRFGISLYGLYPSSTVKKEHQVELKPAFSLKCRLTHVKEVPTNESISYGATYTTKGNEWIGTIPIGYADGWIRKLQGMEVLVNGNRMPIVGRICMDQSMVKLDRYYPVGTLVTLIGKQKGDIIEMDEIADYLDTINYEISCNITSRVPRIYSH
ncbi:MAG TPA: alanine racemase [Bacillota bacterium]|nr:alanine racemase [Bacillota bacterium]